MKWSRMNWQRGESFKVVKLRTQVVFKRADTELLSSGPGGMYRDVVVDEGATRAEHPALDGSARSSTDCPTLWSPSEGVPALTV